MTIAEIRKLEENRQEPSQWNVIHIVKDGNFYHANDWSAWLMLMLHPEMRVTAKRLKDGYIHAFVGFPCTSVEKFLPKDSLISFDAVSDTVQDARIELSADLGEASFENLSALKEAWKEGLKVTEAKESDEKGEGTGQSRRQTKRDREVTAMAPRAMSMFDIVARLLSLRIEDMSPCEALDYLRDMRNEAISLMTGM